MLGRLVASWLILDTKTSCPDFGLSARAGVLALERELHPSSISCAVLDARAWGWPLERGCVSAARAGLCECRSSGELEARAKTWFCKSSGSVYPPLERDC